MISSSCSNRSRACCCRSGLAAPYRSARPARHSGDSDGPLGARGLHLEAVVLHLDVEVAAEEAVEPLGQSFGGGEVVAQDELAEFAGGAAGQADEPLVVGFEQLLVDARDVI